MTRKLKGGAIVDSSVTGTQIETTLVNKITNAYNQANAAYGQANTGSTSGTDAYNQANAAYGQANNARSDANTTFATINTTFGTVNTSLGTVNTSLGTINTNYQAAYAQANTARDTANNAYGSANLAYAAANNSNLKTGGAIVGDISITGNLFVNGVQTVVNTASLTVNDPIFLLANNNTTNAVGLGFVAHYGTNQQHTGLIRAHQDEKWYLFDKYDDHILYSNNVLDTANTKLATLKANIEANNLTVVNGISGNVNFDSGTLFVDSVGDKVGIGTTSPDAKLTVTDTNTFRVSPNYAGTTGIPAGILLSSKSGANVSIIADAASGLAGNGVYISAFSGSQWYRGLSYANKSGTPDLLLQQDGGNVGIGTTNPGVKLDVSGSSTVARFQSSTGYSDINFINSTSSAGYFQYNGNDFRIYANSGSTPTMSITGGAPGNVGIGITNPSNPLHVIGDTFVSANVRSTAFHAGGRSSPYTSISETSSGAMSVFGHNASGRSGSADVIKAQNTGYHSHFIRMYYDQGIAFHTSSTTKTAGDTVFDYLTPANVVSGVAERMRIDISGNVGIGTTNPLAKLDVVGNTYVRSGVLYTDTIYPYSGNQLTFLQGGSNYIYINGKVGIGTATPATQLNIQTGAGNANGVVAIRIGGPTNYESLELGTGPDQYAGFIRSYGNDIHYYAGHWRTVGLSSSEDHSHYWYTSKSGSSNWSTAKMRLNHDGYLGIGTTNPPRRLSINALGTGNYEMVVGWSGSSLSQNATLDVITTHDSYGFQVWDDNNLTTPRFLVTRSGNVGVATTSPRTKLDVVGTVYIEGGSANWSESTPGTTVGSIHLDPGSTTDNFGSAITWGASDSNNGENAFAGIYVRTDGTYGTKMYLATTNSYATGSIVAVTIDHNKNVTVGGTLTESSSVTIKENINPIKDALNLISSINGYTYDRKDGSAKNRPGLLAEEVNEVLPNVVMKDEDGKPSSISYTNLIAYLVESIKELKAEIDELKGE